MCDKSLYFACRYLLIPAKKCEVSLQVTASKLDALIKFEVAKFGMSTVVHSLFLSYLPTPQILDNNNCIMAVEGRGVCTIPLQPLHLREDTGESTGMWNVPSVHICSSIPST